MRPPPPRPVRALITFSVASLELALGSLPAVSANWRFKSRPDLAPPTLNITSPAHSDVEIGYLFMAPFSGYPEGTRHGPLQAAPYIFTDTGDLVWSGFTFFSIWPANFQETIRELRAGNHRLTDKHEFIIIKEKTALIQIYHPVPWNLTAYGGSPEQQWIVVARFQELDIATGDVLFQWSSFDYVDPSEAYLPLTPGQAGSGYNSSDAWDYFHINSVDKDAENNYLISARDANAGYKIDGATGELLWQLGGKSSNFSMRPQVEFAFQHHARFYAKSEDGSKEIISLYDNSAYGTENGKSHEVHFYKYSRGEIIEVDTNTWEAKIVQAYHPPDGLLSKSQGSTQVLPNGNVMVNWGSEGAMTEFKSDGTPLFHTYMDSGLLGDKVENYRGFRYNWTGIPNEAPAIVVLKDEETSTSSVYVSWNGDTRTKLWRFFEVNAGGHRSLLGETKRTSFETSLHLNVELSQLIESSSVQAEAVDGEGVILVNTSAVKPEILVRGFKRKSEKSSTDTHSGVISWLTYKGQKFFRAKDL